MLAITPYACSWPPYASRVQLELLRVVTSQASGTAQAPGPEDYRVQLIYNGRPAALCGFDAGQAVPYAIVQQHIQDLVPPDMSAACAA